MGTLVLSTQYGVIIALYQSCISDTNGQSVEKIFGVTGALTQEKLSEEKFGTGDENYELFVLLKLTVWRLEQTFK